MSNQEQMIAAPKQQACRYPMCGCVVKLDGSWQGCKAEAAPAAAADCEARVEQIEPELAEGVGPW